MASQLDDKKFEYIFKIFEVLVKVFTNTTTTNTILNQISTNTSTANTTLNQILTQDTAIKNNTNPVVLNKTTGTITGTGTLTIANLKAIIIQNTGTSDITVEGLTIKSGQTMTISGGGIRNILPSISYNCGTGTANYYALT
jgi:hypothetical protein